jgi:hypothetical protein
VSGFGIASATIDDGGGGGGGAGDVVGPASATDNNVPRFDLTTGKLLQTSAININDSGVVSPTTNNGGRLGSTAPLRLFESVNISGSYNVRTSGGDNTYGWVDAVGPVLSDAGGGAMTQTFGGGVFTVAWPGSNITPVGLSQTQTLTNKTLDAPTITGALSLPGGVLIITGTGDPESVIAAPVGSTFHRTDDGATSSFYVKESGGGDTGWAGK